MTRSEAGTVRVEGGLLAGVAGDDPAVRVFKGVPFAAPPVGPLRWKPPQPPAPWSGVRSADTFGKSAMQTDPGEFGPWTKPFLFGNAVSEDCLYLNVWTAAAPGEKRPILVYLHGGAFTSGSGEVPLYNGEALAKKGLVVVTLNYRLGVLGFLAHPELTRESEHGASGNYGLLDQVAALRWLQKNGAAFGGDPAKVTIAGQSAGAASVHYLVASPLAKGLFHRAIAQSGSGVGRPMRTRIAAEADGVALGQSKGADSLAKLRALPADQLLGPRMGPVVDGWLLTDDPAATFAQGKQSDVPTLTGLNADEGSFGASYGKLTGDAFVAQARQRYGERADAFLKLYPTDSAGQKRSEREQGMVSLTLWAERRARTAKTRAFLYRFDRVIPWPQRPEFGAFHTSEVPYVFDNLRLLDRPWQPADRETARIASSYWVNFATKGDPNGPGLPRWPAFAASAPRLMRLDERAEPMALPEGARAFFTEVLK